MRPCAGARRLAAAGLCSILLAALGGGEASAQVRGPEVSVDATLNPGRIAAGESTVLQISVETRGQAAQDIELPRLEPGLEITGSQDFSQLQVSVPGGRTRMIRRDIIIRAHLPGQYMIPAVTVTVDGQQFRTRAIALFVDRPRNRPGRSPDTGGDEVQLRAWLEPDTVYVGQQVLLNAEALFPRDLRQRQSRPASYEAPTPSDFWIQDLPDAVATGIRSVDGAVYETQTFRRAYFPLSPGRYTLPPARLVYEIRRGFLYAPEARELISDSLPLVVLPVPQAGRPRAFTGAVGTFSLDARLEPSTLAVGEAATLTVEISGVGNVKALPPPRLAEIAGIEVFPPSEDATVETVDDELRGSKRFAWVIIPESAGVLDLPPVEYAFFDPVRERFETLRSDRITLRVQPEVSGATTASDSALQPLALTPLEPVPWVRNPAFLILQVVPLLALLAGFAASRSSDTVRGRRARRQLRAAREDAFLSLQRAASSAESDRVFYGDFAAAIRAALADMVGQPELRTASRGALLVSLRALGLSERGRADLDDLFARIDHARFGQTPAGHAERSALVTHSKRLLDRIDDELWPRRAPAAAAALLLCAATLGLAPGAVSAQAAPGDFNEGIAAFHDARYGDAVTAFTAHLGVHPGDANGWYNLGNAYMREQRRGYAVWAWLRALAIAPRHEGARRNLAAAVPVQALRAAPHPFVLPTGHALAALALIWWGAGLTVAGLVATRRGSVRRITGIAAAGGLVIAALALPAQLARPVAIGLADRNPLLAGPAARSETVATLEAGTPVTLLERRGEWWRVRSYDGREGWVEAALFAEV